MAIDVLEFRFANIVWQINRVVRMIDGSRHARYEKTINVTSPTANFEDESSDLVPKSWQLCSRTPSSGIRTLASGVLAYDTNDDGHIILLTETQYFSLDRMVEKSTS